MICTAKSPLIPATWHKNILPLATASASQGCGGTIQPLKLVIAKTTMGHAIIDEVARERLGGRKTLPGLMTPAASGHRPRGRLGLGKQ